MKIKKTPSRLPKVLPRNPAALPAKMRRAGTMTNRNEKRSQEPLKFEEWVQQDVGEESDSEEYQGWDPKIDCHFCFMTKGFNLCLRCNQNVCDDKRQYCCGCPPLEEE